MKSNTGTKKGRMSLYVLPIMFILGVLPFVIHLKEFETNLENYDIFSSAIDYDIFLYYKSWAFVIICSIMLALTFAQAFLNHRKLKTAKVFIPLLIYALLSIISAIASKYKPFPFTGIWEQFESLWVLLGYVMTVYYCFVFITSIHDVNAIMNVLTIGTILMLLLGLSQAFSKDLLRTELGRWLILPSEFYNNPEATLDFSFPLGKVYLTLYNPNYVGTYVVLLSPVFLMLAFAKKKLIPGIMNIVIYIGLLLCILGSGSRAGFIGVAFSILLLVIIYNKKLIRFIPEALIVAILIIGVVITYNNYTNGQLFSRLRQALAIERTEYNLEAIETNDDNIVIHYCGDELKVAHEIDETTDYLGISVLDKNNLEVEYDVTLDPEAGGYSFTILDSRFTNISFDFYYISNTPVFYFKIDGEDWNFVYLENSYYYFNHKNKPAKIRNSEQVEALGHYNWAVSGRGFIWARTLPLLKDNILIGSGPDTFLLEFPNNDYVAMRSCKFTDELITKPHNMYLQIAVQTGVLSLICFLVFYFWYFASSVRLYRKADKSKYITMVGIGILSGTFGYMIVGIINDSMVVTAPLFWALIGIGLAINFMIKRDNLFPKIVDAPNESAESRNTEVVNSVSEQNPDQVYAKDQATKQDKKNRQAQDRADDQMTAETVNGLSVKNESDISADYEESTSDSDSNDSVN